MNPGRRRAGALTPAVFALFLAACHGSPPVVAAPATPGPVPSVTALTRLENNLDAALDASALAQGTWGVLVRSLRGSDVLYAKNPGRLLVPASNLKVVTLAVAADRLGWDYTYDTRVFRSGPVQGDVLEGDLIVSGTGDPSLSEEDGSAQRVFEGWAEGLKQLGIRSIAGRIIGDDDAFDDEGFGSGWMWDDMDQAYSAGIGALQLNVDAMAITVTPGASTGAPARLTLSSDGSGLTFRNRVVTGDAATQTRVVTRRLANRSTVEISGVVPLGSGPVSRTVAVENPTLYYVSAVKKALVRKGIDVSGEAVDGDDLAGRPKADGLVPLLSHRSPPLSELAATMMRVSQNQYAETLLKTLGANAGTPTFERGRAIVRETLESWGIPTSDLFYADGSGLSRYNLISPRALVSVLAHVAGDPRLRGPFEASLPVAGMAGMLSERLKGTTAAGIVRAKTGSMGNVRTMSGYMQTADGEPIVFAVMANNYGIPSAEVDKATDALLLEIARFRRQPADPSSLPR